MSELNQCSQPHSEQQYPEGAGVEEKGVREELEEKPTCWICLGEDVSHEAGGAALLTGFCSCKGSLGHAHQHCIDRWVFHEQNGNCPSCKADYLIASTYRGGSPAFPKTFSQKCKLIFKAFLFPVLKSSFKIFIFGVFRFFILPIVYGIFYYSAGNMNSSRSSRFSLRGDGLDSASLFSGSSWGLATSTAEIAQTQAPTSNMMMNAANVEATEDFSWLSILLVGSCVAVSYRAVVSSYNAWFNYFADVNPHLVAVSSSTTTTSNSSSPTRENSTEGGHAVGGQNTASRHSSPDQQQRNQQHNHEGGGVHRGVPPQRTTPHPAVEDDDKNNKNFTSLELILHGFEQAENICCVPSSKKNWAFSYIREMSLILSVLYLVQKLLSLYLLIALLGMLVVARFCVQRYQLQDRRKRFEEAEAARRTAKIEDIRFWFLIYLMDCLFFSMILPTLGALVVHYLPVRFFEQPAEASLAAFVQHQNVTMTASVKDIMSLQFFINTAAWLWSSVSYVVGAVPSQTPLTLLLHWLCGCGLMLCMVNFESHIIFPLFAPGIDFFVVRSLNVRDEELENAWYVVHGQVVDVDPLQVVFDFFRVSIGELVALSIFA